MKLVIVESPTKAKTLGRFLGKDYEVMASMGHIRDLPSNGMNIEIEKDFEPNFELVKGKGKIVKEMQQKAKGASQVYLAMDPDREGEAIASHVKYALEHGLKKKKLDFKRITFHQITKQAVDEAIANAGKINDKLVDAQHARRVLDRLVGYSLSPVLWRKVRRGLSAGRVQSVALRLVVEREREIEAFKEKEYWDIKVEVEKEKDKFWVDLVKVEGKDTVIGKADERKFLISSQDKAKPIVADLKKAKYTVVSVERKERKRYAKPPFTTSTLQQAAGNRLGWTGKRTMSVAQSLYEQGLITYHRTDSTYLAGEAVAAARDYIEKEMGKEYLPEKPTFYKTKSKSAQEAHEAIRPTGVKVDPKSLNSDVDAAGKKLYLMIWRRYVASQMMPAIYDATTVVVDGKGEKDYQLKATGSIMKFEGWLKVYDGKQEEEVELPVLTQGDGLAYQDIAFEQKFTQPPPRYNDASLVKTLEELGIGRPSTYAPTISTLMGRGYMERNEKRFEPTPVGMTVTDFLTENFKDVMDYDFTAEMENELDEIAQGERDWVGMMKEFWQPFNKKVETVTEKAPRAKVPVEKTGEKCPECKEGELVIRSGRFGKFISCSRFPECKYTAKYEETVDGMKCEKCGKGEIVIKRTRKGRTFYGCSRYPECDFASWTKPNKS